MEFSLSHRAHGKTASKNCVGRYAAVKVHEFLRYNILTVYLYLGVLNRTGVGKSTQDRKVPAQRPEGPSVQARPPDCHD